MFRNERPTYLLNLEPIKVEIFTEFTLHCNEEYSGASKCLSTYLPSISTSNKQHEYTTKYQRKCDQKNKSRSWLSSKARFDFTEAKKIEKHVTRCHYTVPDNMDCQIKYYRVKTIVIHFKNILLLFSVDYNVISVHRGNLTSIQGT